MIYSKTNEKTFSSPLQTKADVQIIGFGLVLDDMV